MPKQISVCHLTPTWFSEASVIGGGERYVDNIAKALSVTNSDAVLLKQDIISVLPQGKKQLPSGGNLYLLENISTINGEMNCVPADLWKHIGKYDLLHIHQALTNFGAYCALVAASLHIPFVVTDHGGGSSPIMLDGKALELAGAVIALSRYAAAQMAGAYSGRIAIQGGPVDTDWYRPATKVKDDKYALCVGRLLPHKGVDIIIRALPKSLPLKVVGRVYDEEYFNLLRGLAEGKNVDFLTAVDDLRLLELYQHAGIFVEASTHKDIYGNQIQKPELMGLAPLEAMACGIPTFLSDAGALPELIPASGIGRVFGSHDELQTLFEEYVSGAWPDPGASRRIRAHVVEKYSLPAVGAGILRVYEDVLGL